MGGMMFIPKDVSKVVITHHVVDRFKQRFRLYLRQHELENIQSTIELEFRKSRQDKKYVFSPFYKNKLESIHGIDSFVSETKLLVFGGVYSKERNSVLIRTVWKKEKENGI
jgi:hypothetical protein